MATDVQVPALGESITEGTLAQWLKKVGDAVAADEPIASLETDKVTVEVPSPVAGVLAEQVADEGETVAVGAVIARIDEGGGAASPAADAAAATTNPSGAGENPTLRGDDHAPEPERQASAADTPPAEAAPEPAAAAPTDTVTTLSPAVRRAVLEHHVDPSKIKGSGKDGRLTKDDVLAAAEAAKSSPAKAGDAPASSPAQAGAQAPQAKAAAPESKAPPPGPRPAPGNRTEERVKMSRLRQTIATRLKEAQNTAALLTTFNDVDMTAVIEARTRYKDLFEKKHGIRLGFMGFFVKAVALATRDIPSVNARSDGAALVYHDYRALPIAVSAPKGLVVPVVRNAQALSFAEIEKTIADYGKRAKDGTLGIEEMQGGTFTISNGGVFGSLLSTPIINPPQSAVLGMHRIGERPVGKDGGVVIRPMMNLALSDDHRLVDGREAVTFLVRVKEAIEDPTRLLIDL